MNVRKKFSADVANSLPEADFNSIKEQINYDEALNYSLPPKKVFPYKLVLTPIVSLLLIFSFALIIIQNQTTKNINDKAKEALSAPLEIETEQVKAIDDEHIYIDYSIVCVGCDLTKHISSNANWDVYAKGKKVDKSHLNLSYGTNEYLVRFYRGNQIIKDYDVEIKVGN